MPRRPTSLHFPLRHRRASPANVPADDTAGGTTDASPQANTPVNRTSTTSPTSPTSSVSSSRIMRRSLGSGSPMTPSKSVTAAAALQTRAELRMCVRSDWDYPLPPDTEMETTRVEHDTLYMPRELEFSSRPNSSSPSPMRPALSNGFATHPDDDPDAAPENPYRFEDPDAVEDAVLSRRERWEMEQREERRINPGLRHWEDQRDIWTGAVLLRRDEMEGVVRHVELETDDEFDDVAEAAAQKRRIKRRRCAAKPNYSHHVPAPSSGESVPPSQEDLANGTNGTVAHETRSPTPSICSHNSLPPAVPVPPLEPLVPRPPPLISASHPIRSQITPHAYRSIYTRIVVQGTSPSIPVNLSDVISACVVGWKADGEWPPRQMAPPAGGGHRRPKSESLAAAAMFGTTGFDANDYVHSTPPTKTKRRSRRLGSLMLGGRGVMGADPPQPPPPEDEVVYVAPGLVEDETRDIWEQDGFEPDGKVLSAMGRGVRRVGRALKSMGTAMIEPDLAMENERVEGDVPGLVQRDLGGAFDEERIHLPNGAFEGAREGTFEQREI